jgi:hypothetical protein
MSVHHFAFHLLLTAHCLLPTGAGVPLSGMEHPQIMRLLGDTRKIRGDSKTEIPLVTLCINNKGGVPKIETIRGTFRSSEGNT